LYLARTGIPLRDLPAEFGRRVTVQNRIRSLFVGQGLPAPRRPCLDRHRLARDGGAGAAADGMDSFLFGIEEECPTVVETGAAADVHASAAPWPPRAIVRRITNRPPSSVPVDSSGSWTSLDRIAAPPAARRPVNRSATTSTGDPDHDRDHSRREVALLVTSVILGYRLRPRG